LVQVWPPSVEFQSAALPPPHAELKPLTVI